MVNREDIMQTQEIYRQYYTKSIPLANYMVEMLAVQPGMRILEPCAGDGELIDRLMTKVPNLVIDACELNSGSYLLLKEKYRSNKNIQVKHVDTVVDDEMMLLSNLGGIYDRIIANPPYGGWQDYDKRKDLKRLYPEIYVKETYAIFCIDV
jgi:16S rRNA A1518/A1519 N6-dimethyltransferase RsmA/KsgA/DIM1 with predicted DNA glycosylase/AP lyase activity